MAITQERVDAATEWQYLTSVVYGNIVILAGASGSWTFNNRTSWWCGPDGWTGNLNAVPPGDLQNRLILPGLRVGTLLVKVVYNDVKLTVMGPQGLGSGVLQFTAQGSGNIYLSMNDIDGAFGDNSGSMVVNLSIADGSTTGSDNLKKKHPKPKKPKPKPKLSHPKS